MSEKIGLGDKAPLLAISLVLSLILWVYVQATQPSGAILGELSIGAANTDRFSSRYIVPSDFGQVAVRIDGPADQLDVPGETQQKTADRILRLCRAVAFVDLADAKVGNHNYPIHIQYLTNLGFSLTLGQASTGVDIELQSTKTLPITVDARGQLPSGSNLLFNNATASPGIVTIEGPSADVSNVKRIRVLLDLSQITDGKKSLYGTPEPLDEGDHPVPTVSVTPSAVALLPSLTPAAESQVVLVEPKMKGHPAMGFTVTDYSIEPNQVALQGQPDVLAKLKTIGTKPISLDGLRSSTQFDAVLDLPPGVKSASVRTVRFKITIEPSEINTSTNAPAATSP